MAKFTVTIKADTAKTYVCDMKKSREYWCWFATLVAQGTFGGGTIAWFYSIDSGTTLISLNDLLGNPITQTTNSGVNSQFGSGNTNTDNPQLYVTMTGSTSPNVLVACLDNRS